MTKILTFLALIFISTPSQAITWEEFWEPFSYEYGSKIKTVECYKTIYYERYIPGNGYSRGYVRSWIEKVRIPCR